MLQPPILILQLLQRLRPAHFHPAVFSLLAIERGRADSHSLLVQGSCQLC
jgi:hypothetical protein